MDWLIVFWIAATIGSMVAYAYLTWEADPVEVPRAARPYTKSH